MVSEWQVRQDGAGDVQLMAEHHVGDIICMPVVDASGDLAVGGLP